MLKIKYTANNSGGSWWLKDEDWKALAAAGWTVQWGDYYFCLRPDGTDYNFGKTPPPGYVACANPKECPGHYAPTVEDVEQGRWRRYMGALAKDAEIEVEIPADAIRSFEKATGQDASAEGCNCCGAPHSFTWTDGAGQYQYASGASVAEMLTGIGGLSYREALEKLAKKEEEL